MAARRKWEGLVQVRNARNRVLAGLVAALVLGATSSATVLGTGEAAVAQIEFAFTCNATDDPFCAPEYFGIRYRATLWDGGSATIAGAYSKHQRGGPGAGAESLHGTATWWASTGPDGPPVATDPNDLYYNLDLGSGALAFPQTPGHYSYRPGPGVSGQIQVTD